MSNRMPPESAGSDPVAEKRINADAFPALNKKELDAGTNEKPLVVQLGLLTWTRYLSVVWILEIFPYSTDV